MAIAYSDRYVTLTWTAASDDVTPASAIVYDICVSRTSGSCASNFLVTDTTDAGATLWNVGNLVQGANYYFLVRARDQAGNRDDNLIELQAQPKLPSAQHSLAVGSDHTCALLNDGTARCWGYNGYGALGDGTTTQRLAPVAVSGISSAVALTAGENHTCALLANGTARCWGSNYAGQLGDGTTTERSTPVAVSGLSGAVALTAGGAHTCALLANGTARCWGDNNNGQLGDGTTTGRLTPVAVQGGHGALLSLVSGPAALHTCAVTADGTALCWGFNYYGQLGNGTTTNSSSPVLVSGLSGIAY
jgi:alpha-tubulin suppressor-like RCC1 family protein